MQTYSLGFAFDKTRENLLLITKNRPAWQAGKWNGIGGKIEAGETPLHCMVREFEEETGLRTEAFQWSFLTSFHSPDFMVYAFHMSDDNIHNATSMTDEQVAIVPVSLDLIRSHSMNNLPWLISLALDPDQARLNITAMYF